MGENLQSILLVFREKDQSIRAEKRLNLSSDKLLGNGVCVAKVLKSWVGDAGGAELEVSFVLLPLFLIIY